MKPVFLLGPFLLSVSPGAASAASEGSPSAGATRLWFDADGDSLADLYLSGGARPDVLLRNNGDGTFDDATEHLGLAGLASRRVAVVDLDGDGDTDLLRVAADGTVRLHLCVDGTYDDVSAAFGLAASATDARWVDYDRDGWPDLELVCGPGETRLFHNRDGLVLDEVVLQLPPAAAAVAPVALAPPAATPAASGPGVAAVAEAGARSAPTPSAAGPLERASAPGAGPRGVERVAAEAPEPREPAPEGAGGALLTCAGSIADAAGGCLRASSTPALGRLYPLSQDLMVRPGGQVTIGVDPGFPAVAKLHVDGNAWFQEPAFFNPNPAFASAAATGFGASSLYRGYLGLDGGAVTFFSGAWTGLDVGVAGISIDGGTADNYGVLGRSNNVAVRGENDVVPANYAMLGTPAEGLVAAGLSTAATFLNTIRTYGEGWFRGNLAVGGSTPFASGDQLHVRSAFDARVRIEADSDNVNESDHPALVLSQDGGIVTASLTFEEGSNNLLLDVPYGYSETYFRLFDTSGVVNDWEFQNFTDVEARLTDLGNLQLDGSVSSPAADLAEYFPLAEPVAPGEVVAFVGEEPRLARALAGRTPRLAGIVSSKPGLLLGIGMTDEASEAVPPPPLGDDERYLGPTPELEVDRLVLHEIEANRRAPLALSGRVPCRVSAENGPIRAGDPLGAARLPGHAARAVEAGPVVGTALQSLDEGTGTIVVLAGLGWYAPDEGGRIEALERELAALRAEVGALGR